MALSRDQSTGGDTGPVVPTYLGGGVGVGHESNITTDTWEETVHFLAGVGVALSDTWGLRTELRIRAVDPFIGTTGDIGFGVTRGIF